MVQFFNAPAVRALGKIIRNPSLLEPRTTLDLSRRVDWKRLGRDLKVEWVLFDKDNTLTLPYEDELHSSTKSAFEDCAREFGQNRVFVVSNSIGSSDDDSFVFSPRTHEYNLITHSSKKPDLEILKSLPVDPTKTLVVGDRLLTDVVFGNLMGGISALCSPIDRSKDPSFVKPIRLLEEAIVVLRSRGAPTRRPAPRT